MTDFPQVGDLAPDFSLLDQERRPWWLSSHRQAKVIVYFYPAAFTPGCTTEACEFRDNRSLLTELGYTVIGISPDTPEVNRDFHHEQRLDFPLLSDPDHLVHDSFDSWGERPFKGVVSVGARRSTFVIDESGVVVVAWREVDPNGQVDRLLAELTRLADVDQR